MKKMIEEIFLAGVKSVLPNILIQSQLQIDGKTLTICGQNYNLQNINHIYVIGAGKASALMAKEIENVLGNRIKEGHVITKYDHGCKLDRIILSEAAHPIPDINGLNATKEILKITKKANEKDLVICLISGGASALLVDTPSDITLDELRITNEILIKSGANITEINTIRKHLSEIKGGQLAKSIYPANAISLILSDVVGDPLEVIASGPTVADNSTYKDAYAIMKRFKLHEQFPVTVTKRLLLGKIGIIPDTTKDTHPCFQSTRNCILGSNKTALNTAADVAMRKGFKTIIVADNLQDDYLKVADFILNKIDENSFNKKKKHPVCLLFGGEPTVPVRGEGLGGRNQHIALYLATKIQNKPNVTILCAGTDGTDGPTNAAGAVVDNKTVGKALNSGFNAYQYLQEFDSYHFFNQYGGHIITGSTQTNVMDIIVIIMNQNEL